MRVPPTSNEWPPHSPRLSPWIAKIRGRFGNVPVCSSYPDVRVQLRAVPLLVLVLVLCRVVPRARLATVENTPPIVYTARRTPKPTISIMSNTVRSEKFLPVPLVADSIHFTSHHPQEPWMTISFS